MITDGSLRIPHSLNGGVGDINQLVKRWNHRAMIDIASDRENYVNGDIKFLFEYSGFRNSRRPTLSTIQRRNIPRHVPVVLAESTIDKAAREVGDLFDKHLRGNPCVVSGWDKKLVLIEDVEFVDEREIFIPARLTMGFQIEKNLIEGWRDPIGESRLYGFIKPCLGFTKGKLQPPSFLVGSCKGGHDVPIGVIESGAEVVNGISANDCGPVYDGCVSFCEGGALSSLCIRFENVGERSLFLEQYVQLVDVFRGPMNLETSAIGHRNETPNVM
jgi:hypothetical protein